MYHLTTQMFIKQVNTWDFSITKINITPIGKKKTFISIQEIVYNTSSEGGHLANAL